jgi:serine/threonine-protein kinase RsbW
MGVRQCPASTVMVWRRAFPGRAEQVSGVRRLVRTLLEDTSRADDAEWIVSELATNALIHSVSGERGGVLVVVVRWKDAVRLAVHDQGGGGVPAFARLVRSTLGEHGYGLRAVARIASRVVVRGGPEHGHVVSAYLSLRDADERRVS